MVPLGEPKVAIKEVAAVVGRRGVASEDPSGVDGGDGKGGEPENIQINVEDEYGPVVVGAGGAGVGADEPDGGDDGADALAGSGDC